MDTNDHIGKAEVRESKAWFAAIILSALMLWFCGCRDIDPPPTLEEQLKGAWKRDWLTFTETYSFDDGQCLVYGTVPAQPVQFYGYAYFCDKDTLTMLDLATKDVNRAVVSFPTDTTCVLAWIGGVEYNLKRL